MADAREVSGFDQTALDQASKAGFASGAFEDSEEETVQIVDEFYPDLSAHPHEQAPGQKPAGRWPTNGRQKVSRMLKHQFHPHNLMNNQQPRATAPDFLAINSFSQYLTRHKSLRPRGQQAVVLW